MSYKTIVVHLDCGERRSERLGLSIEIAAAFDAHLLGVFALDTMRVPAYALAEAGPAIMEIERRRRADAALQAEREFRERVANRVANAEWRTLAGIRWTLSRSARGARILWSSDSSIQRPAKRTAYRRILCRT